MFYACSMFKLNIILVTHTDTDDIYCFMLLVSVVKLFNAVS